MAASNVRQVWRQDLEVAIDELRALSDKYPYISVNSLWPGFVSRPIVHAEYAYATIKDTCNLSNLLQLGFSLADSRGRKPTYPNAFQFNFLHNHSKDCLVDEVVDAYIQQGWDSQKAERDGIDPIEFGEVLSSSGVVMNEDIRWITYHGAYDLGFLFKSLANKLLPETANDFTMYVADYFPNHYDVKYLLSKHIAFGELGSLRKSCELVGLKGITHLANPDLSCRAGLNALLVSACFYNTLKRFYDNTLDDTAFNGLLYGLLDPTLDDLYANSAEETKLPPGMLRLKPGTYKSNPHVVVEHK